MENKNFVNVKEYVYKLMKEKLPNNLYYHSIHHTFDDVLPNAIEIAKLENITGDDLIIIKTAALFHDLGFIVKYKGHEDESIKFAKEILPKFDYSNEEIKLINCLIDGTKVSLKKNLIIQKVKSNILSKIICDADLDNLGRDDFFSCSSNLKKEREKNNFKSRDELSWLNGLREMLINQKYKTEANQKRRKAGLKRNLELINSKIRNF